MVRVKVGLDRGWPGEIVAAIAKLSSRLSLTKCAIAKTPLSLRSHATFADEIAFLKAELRRVDVAAMFWQERHA